MKAATECLFEDQRISIELALEYRQIGRHHFFCIECGQQVRAHRAGENSKAHFEHFKKNVECSYSQGALSNGISDSGSVPDLEIFEIDSHQALEGYAIDQKLLQGARNQALALQRKKIDQYTCLACGFFLNLNGHHVIECHHLRPIALGARETNLQDLVSLCPTCHRIAHTRKVPLSVAEIKYIRGIFTE